MSITKAMRYEIVKPTDCTWEDFGKVLNSLRYKCARIANHSIQMLWDWNNFKYAYKKEHGAYPDKSETPNFYKLLREEFPDVGTQVISQTLQYVQIKFMRDLKDVCSLKKGIPFYKDNMPICVHNQAYVVRNMDGYEISARLLPNDTSQYWFSFLIKKGSNGQRSILERINSGEYKKGMLQMVRDQHKKWYAVISFTFEPALKSGGQGVLEVSLNSEKITLKKGDYVKDVSIKHVTESIERLDKRLASLREQKQYRGEGRRGHGVKAIFKPMQTREVKKANFKTTINHNLSRDIINTALRWHCGIIIMSGEIPWTTFDLQGKVKYKAEENGLEFKLA